MKKIEIHGVSYELVRNVGNCFSKEDVVEKITDYFDDYDYIFGDYAYEKVRLKGYYETTNKKAKKINDIANIKSSMFTLVTINQKTTNFTIDTYQVTAPTNNSLKIKIPVSKPDMSVESFILFV